jgi:L-aspartate oxidase
VAAAGTPAVPALRAGAPVAAGPAAAGSPPAPTPAGPGSDACELANLAQVGAALCAAALARDESRGAHTRSDAPDASPDRLVRYVIGGP